MMVSAFGDKDFIMKAYKEAMKKKYKFSSYGDAMMII
jgi:S-adenosylmethionine:tRNA ribosyltransferase-isomerase